MRPEGLSQSQPPRSGLLSSDATNRATALCPYGTCIPFKYITNWVMNVHYKTDFFFSCVKLRSGEAEKEYIVVECSPFTLNL